ncbi:MAG: hypothetical protein IPM91_05820 [Bacteroidetes bacterium]|nr:hypothetical protein [Bacteroidota bacterium]
MWGVWRYNLRVLSGVYNVEHLQRTDGLHFYQGLKSAYCIKLLFAVGENPGNQAYFDRTEIDGSVENNFFSSNYSNVQPPGL